MSNMSYCRFQNTVRDLQDCLAHIEDTDLSMEEFLARECLLRVVAAISEIEDDCQFSKIEWATYEKEGLELREMDEEFESADQP